MIDKYCEWTQGKNGKLICATLSTVGGLHLLMTAQQIVGIGLLTCGVCCLVACRGSPVANMMDM
jgi:hypothetical protein